MESINLQQTDGIINMEFLEVYILLYTKTQRILRLDSFQILEIPEATDGLLFSVPSPPPSLRGTRQTGSRRSSTARRVAPSTTLAMPTYSPWSTTARLPPACRAQALARRLSTPSLRGLLRRAMRPCLGCEAWQARSTTTRHRAWRLQLGSGARLLQPGSRMMCGDDRDLERGATVAGIQLPRSAATTT